MRYSCSRQKLLAGPLLFAALVTFTVPVAAQRLPTDHRPSASSKIITQVPLYIHQGHVTVEVKVNGQRPFLFGLDTGASHAAWVSRALVEQLNLPTVEGFRVSDGSGRGSRNADGVRIDALKLGEISFDRIVAPVLGDGPAAKGNLQMYGSIGFELFKNYLVTLDYPAKQLRIATGELTEAHSQNVLNYTLDHRTPQVEIKIGRLSIRALIDTGANGGILLPLSLLNKVELQTQARVVGRISSNLNEAKLLRGQLQGRLQIGNLSFDNPVLLFAALFEHAIIGRDILHQFALTFDQKNQRVRFERAQATR